ncbi:hypothetical protein [Sphingomonas prati]|uniref:Uncharacterized protein n=1 Tax=Sphingomonas prati TaxID=1843237 RepID=A0A7W9F2M3_9SPHN|nr:hypothetical protein [Sphingomonas prati]MBB5730533.1 hypothetical protein [Sphingomonas prati]
MDLRKPYDRDIHAGVEQCLPGQFGGDPRIGMVRVEPVLGGGAAATLLTDDGTLPRERLNNCRGPAQSSRRCGTTTTSQDMRTD